MIRLGEQRKNPYLLANMQRALDTIKSQLAQNNSPRSRAFREPTERITIETTDLYVRFLPKDYDEMDKLAADTTLELFAYPLDRELETEGDYYHDPSIPINKPTWQYAVVKPDYKLPDVKHEVMAELFLPTSSEHYRVEDDRRDGYSTTRSLRLLETVSLYLTDNLPKEEKERIEKRQRMAPAAGRICVWFICWYEPDPWSPSGLVTVEEKVSGASPPSPGSTPPSLPPGVSPNMFVQGIARTSPPVKRVRARARRWFTVHTRYTDDDGYFFMHNVFRRPANYSLVFANEYMRVKASWFTGLFSSARYNGPKQRIAWNITFYYNSVGWLWSNIMTANYDYRYIHAPKYGIRSLGSLRIVANQGGGTSACHMLHRTAVLGWLFNDLRIYKSGKDSKGIYALMMHELGHASHYAVTGNELYIWTLGYDAYVRQYVPRFSLRGPSLVHFLPPDKDRKTLLETWAESTEMVFTREVYSDYQMDTSSGRSSLQNEYLSYWQGQSVSGYISVLHEDLLDTYDQSVKNTLRPHDSVSGYSLSQVYYALRGASRMNEWRRNLYTNHPNNPTRGYLEGYFKQYHNDF